LIDIDEIFECPCMLCVKRRKDKMKKDCCENDDNGLEVLTPYPKERNKAEKFFNRYNHIMEFTRTMLAITTLGLQLIILYRLTN